MKIIVILGLLFATQITSFAQCANYGTLPSQDFDCDGIINSIDIDDDNDGVLDVTECSPCVSDPFTNGGFELPNYTTASYHIIPQSSVPGWQTTASDNMIELWDSGFNGVPAAEGDQFVELNANMVSTLYQTFCVNGASGTIDWSIKHRGRSGTDVARVKIGSSLATAVQVVSMTDGSTAWGSYSGTYTIPLGMTNVVIAFESVSAAGGSLSVGNFLDDIKITINQGCGDYDGDGLPNSMDLDSDGDGCSDAYESGATTVLTSNYVFAGAVGTNGFINSKETATDNGVINYTSTYSNAVNNLVKSCCPTVTAPSNQAICQGANTTAVNFSGGISGTTYTWTNNNTAIGLAASGTGNIAAFSGLNTGTTPLIATITVTPATSSCTGAAQTFTITVNPKPVITPIPNQTICNNVPATLTATPSGATYLWSTSATTQSISAGTGTYTVTVTNSYTCSNTSSTTLTNTNSPIGVAVTAANTSCWSGAARNDGKLTLTGFAATTRYQYAAGSTFSTALATPAAITTIPTNGIIATALANPSTASQVYTVRLYHATNDNCYTDITATLNQVNCTCPINCGTIQLQKN